MRLVQDTPSGQVLDPSGLTALDWSIAASILVTGLVLSVFVRRAIITILRRGTTLESIAEKLVGTIVQAVIILVAFSYALGILNVQIGPLLGALGLGGFAVALALQETLKNLFAGIILHAQRPVKPGEEVVSGEMQGVVLDITSRAVTLQSNSGRVLYVPNSLLLDREIINLVRHGKRRTTLAVGVAYGSNLGETQRVLLDATSDADGVLTTPPPRVLCTGFGDSSVNFAIDFWHGPNETDRRTAYSTVSVAVYDALADAGITIPFPQRTLWMGEQTNTTDQPPDA